MSRLAFVAYRSLAAGLVLIAGAACLASTDSGRGRRSDGWLSNPLEPPLACTLIGCEDGLKVQLRPASGWPAGEYRFEIQAEGVRVTCRGSIPLTACTGGPSLPRTVTCDPEDVIRIVESGCALPAQAQGFPELWFDPKFRPRKLEITITRDGQIVAGANLVPSFQKVYPNGPECPPACDVARAVLDLDF